MWRPPPGFDTVSTAQSKKAAVSLIAAVSSTLPPRRTAHSYVRTLELKDVNYESPAYGLKVRYFHAQQDHLPDVERGDVVLLRGLRWQRGAGVYASTDNDEVAWTRWRRALPVPQMASKPGAPAPTADEIAYAKRLLDRTPVQEQSSYQQVNVPEPQKKALPRRFCLLEDARVNTFIDLTGQVVKTAGHYEKFILYITDYTSNSSLVDYRYASDESRFRYTDDWPGPYGTMTIAVTLFEPHAGFARSAVKVDDYVSLSNVHVKQYQNRMEASLHEDRAYPHKISVRLLDGNSSDAQFRELEARKQKYWADFRTLQGLNPLSKKRPRSSDIQLHEKKENLKKKKLQKEAEEKRKKKKDPEQPELGLSVIAKRDELSAQVRAENPATPYRLIRDILLPDTHLLKLADGTELQQPFQNFRYRSSVRVVDFFPHSIEDFSVLYNPDAGDNSLSVSGDSCDEDSLPDARRAWQWRFCLLVEDGGPNIPHYPRGQIRERMPLFVSGPDAECLLKLNAENLRDDQNSQTLDLLRERLRILWGDLEERKNKDLDAFYSTQTDAPSAMPFSCCIKEYGVRSRSVDCPAGRDTTNNLGWVRRFHMFGTTIMT